MINFKKVASILASGVMLASTISFAAAANLYPKPFTDGAAIVYGSNAASSDMAGAIDIYDQLKTRVGTSSTASVSGEAKAVETASQPLYLGDYMNRTKETFSENELPNILKDGKVTDDDGTDLDYELKLDVLKSSVIYGDGPDNLESPVIYADTNSNGHTYSLKVIFPTAANLSKLTDEDIVLFGKQYVFSGSASDLSSAGDGTARKVVLFEKATSVIVNDGESVTAEGHTISAAIEDATTAAITIDGVTESKAEGWSGKVGTVDIYIKNVVGPNVAGTSRYVEVYLNSNKLTLVNGNEVKVASTDIDGTNISIGVSGSKTTEIKIDVTPYDFDDTIKYLKMGDSFTDPVFGGVKFNLVSITPELEDSSRDEIIIKATGENTAGIKFTNKAGKVYDMDLLRKSSIGINSSLYTNNGTGLTCYNGGGACGASTTYNATELGVGVDYDLIAYPTGSSNSTRTDSQGGGGHGNEVMIHENDYFITCSNEYTQIWRMKSVKPASSELKIEDQGSGSDVVTISLTTTVQGGTGTLTLGDGSTTTLTMNTTSAVTSDKACSFLYTKNGAKIRLNQAGYTATNETATSKVIVEEETAYNGGAFTDASSANLGKNVTIQFRWESGRTGRDMNLLQGSAIPSGTLDADYWTDDVGDYDDYYVTKYGTFMKVEGNTDNIATIQYPEDAMSVGFYIGEVTSEITPGSTGGAGGQIAIVKDSEASTVASKHLIVVGGSCVNTVAAKILASDAPLCGADFTAVTKVDAGGYIIKTVASPENADKVAMLVAGYNAADTTNAVARAMVIDGVKTDVGSEEIFPVIA